MKLIPPFFKAKKDRSFPSYLFIKEYKEDSQTFLVNSTISKISLFTYRLGTDLDFYFHELK